MSRATVRAAIAAYLAPGPITNLATTFASSPKITQGGDFAVGQSPGDGGAVIHIFIERHHEKRIAFGGAHGGRKWRPYDVALMCFYRSPKQKSEDIDADNDVFVDSLIAHIHADRTLNSAGAIFQAGEGDLAGGQDVEVLSQLPVILGTGTVQIYTVVRLTVCEVIVT